MAADDTQPGAVHGPFDTVGHAAAWDDLGEVLLASNYRQEPLAAVLGIEHPGESMDPIRVARRFRDDTPFNLLGRLFLLGHPVPRPVLTDVLPDLPLEALTAAGLFSGDAEVRSRTRISTYHDVYVFSDFDVAAADHVLGVGPASVTLACTVPPVAAETALDVGTGSGIQAFLCARQCGHVIGTDINPKALNYAAAGALVNGIGNVSWRRGSLFEPVEGDSFDLITANPPFVISPENRFQYRDSGALGDHISQTVIRRIGAHLRPGGFAVVIFNWHHGEADAWADRPLSWIEDTGCDAWLICAKTADALSYAVEWLRNCSVAQGQGGYSDEELDAWLAYYDRLGIADVSGGVMIMQRRDGVNWRRADHLGECRSFGSCGPMVQRVFANETWLQAHPSAHDLLAETLRLVPECRVEQTLRPEDGQLVLCDTHIALRAGLNFGGHMDVHAVSLAAGLDGRTPLRQHIDDLAARMEVSVEAIVEGAVAVIQKLMRAGLVERCGEECAG